MEETDGKRAIWHWGDNPGFKGFVMALTDSQEGVVMLANGDGAAHVWEPLVSRIFVGPHPLFAWLAQLD